MKDLSETDSPQGVIAVCVLPGYVEVPARSGRFLMIDRVQDPGNIGTLIRTADAVGLDGIILEKGSVDIYNSKVIRASQGSIFHVPIVKGDLLEWVHTFKQAGVPVFGTSLQQASSYTAIEPQKNFALILGNEGEGVQKQLLDETDQNLYIPIYGKAESLNVAIAAEFCCIIYEMNLFKSYGCEEAGIHYNKEQIHTHKC
ncbi:TrmH family RNA methyltransferase [Alkalicoccobacillus plakortidis]|uniref:TrmH family RNA methyltransferase n=1 Tax=Alkalicoccobacillus plakortidis TaxID=444060 RepID=UPI0027D98552|nr:TrmH family RNA methyltransferase [Alkalicoccobacillus plakortidis]